MRKLFSVVEIAEMANLTPKRINQLGPELIKAGHGQKVGKVLVFNRAAATYIKNRPDGRSRTKKK